MKLLHKNIITNILISLLVVCLGGLITYVFVKKSIESESREHLINDKKIIEHELKEGVSIKLFEHSVGDKVWIKEIPKLSGKKEYFKQIEQKEIEEEEGEESVFVATSIVFECISNNKFYEITVIKYFDEDEELAENVLTAVVISAFLMIVIMVGGNIFVYRKLWQPFYSILKTLQLFNVSKQSKIILPKTSTEEFNNLNQALVIMAEKNKRDYIALKEFTENASHEIQTPLAIISSKIEICLQDTQLNDLQFKLLIEASQSIGTLSNLNKGLIMLTKLDNKQFEDLKDINVFDVFLQRVNIFEEFIQKNEIDVEYKIDKKCTLKINPLLSEILLDNLIKNAVKHNIKRGKIIIEATDKFIKISNTGVELKANKEKLFERFYKAGKEDSLGLGLAIVKKICETYGFDISYNYVEDWHSFTLNMNNY